MANDNPAYLVVQLTVKDLDDFIKRYAIDVIGQIQRFGGEVLVAGTSEVLEGKLDGNRTVVIRFPNRKALDDFYTAPEYLPYKDLRMKELTSDGWVVVGEGFDPSVLG